MAEASPHHWSDSERAAIRSQVERIIKSAPFQQSQRRQRFLDYIVREAIEGRPEKLKGYAIAVDVFDKPASFDPLNDPIVRVEAARLRDKLREYYETEGQADPVRIDMPKGSYVPQIDIRSAVLVENTSAPGTDPAKRRLVPAWLPKGPKAVAGTALAALVLSFSGWSAWQQSSPAGQGTDKLTVAVMPFENIGGDQAWSRLADGISADITADLSQSKDLLVIARVSTDVYRGKSVDVRDVGRDLGVRYVIDGSIQPSDHRIRVTVNLIDARSGANVLSRRYNRPSSDLFAVQTDVTDSIAGTLLGYQGALAEVERKLIHRKPPSVLNAYEHYLLGIEAKHGGASGGVTKEGLEEAERRFLKAIEIDPQLARAYVGLAYVYEYRLDLGIGSPDESTKRLLDVTNTAVRLDPNDGEAQMVLGHAYVYQGLFDQALQQFARAEALAPSNADVLILIGWYLAQMDQAPRAVALAERALRLNPNYPKWYNQALRCIYFFGGDFEKAVKFVRLVPHPNPLDYAYLAMASAMLTDMPAANTAQGELRERDPHWNIEAYLSDNGGFPEKPEALFVEAARKAGVPVCAPAGTVAQSKSFLHLKVCDEERAGAQAKEEASK